MPVTQEFIESLMKQNQMLIEQVDLLSKTINELNATIKELREQLNKNSGNSSKPPSTDGFKKVNKSLREKSGKKRGGQKGHQGTHLAVLSKPDEIKRYMHADCTSCPYRDKCASKACVKETRNVIDAVVEVNITAQDEFCQGYFLPKLLLFFFAIRPKADDAFYAKLKPAFYHNSDNQL